MQFTTSLTLFLAAFVSALFAAAGASPMALGARDVFDPPVLYPHAGTVWTVGQHHNVTWCGVSGPLLQSLYPDSDVCYL